MVASAPYALLRRYDEVCEPGEVMLPEQCHLMLVLGALQTLEVEHSGDNSARNEVVAE